MIFPHQHPSIKNCHKFLDLHVCAFARFLVGLVKRVHELDELGSELVREIVRLLAERIERLGIVLLVRLGHALI